MTIISRPSTDSLPHADSLITFTHNGLEFTYSSRDGFKYNDVPDQSTRYLIHRLESHPNKYRPGTMYSWPPKAKSQKWWRALCAFRELDPKGTIPDMQERVREWVQAEKDGRQCKRYVVVKRLNIALRAELEKVDKPRATANRILRGEGTFQWTPSSAEERFSRDCLHFLKHEAFADGGSAVYTFKVRPQLTRENLDVLIRLSCGVERYSDYDRNWGLYKTGAYKPDANGFCLIFTEPQPEESQYSRGAFDKSLGWPVINHENIGRIPNICGKTWVGAGFAKGVIIGRTQASVMQKIRDICDKVEMERFKSYMEKEKSILKTEQMIPHMADENHIWIKQELQDETEIMPVVEVKKEIKEEKALQECMLSETVDMQSKSTSFTHRTSHPITGSILVKPEPRIPTKHSRPSLINTKRTISDADDTFELPSFKSQRLRN